jgi:ABC-2 type transport system permease protein/sodium transport system permease protein
MTPPTTSGWSAGLGRQLRLTRKELVEILRDRRTILTLVAMPLLVYPLLALGFQQLFQTVAPRLEPKFVVGCADRFTIAAFGILLDEGEAALKEQLPEGAKAPSWEVREIEATDEALKMGEIDVVVEAPRGKGHDFRLRAIWMQNSAAGQTAANWLSKLVAAANDRTLGKLLKQPNADPREFRFRLERKIETGPQGDGLVSLTSVIPFILILMTITGAVYPAIDLTAGERERGTLEILVAAPVPRLRILAAKYVAVVFVAVLTALVNLTAMTLTLRLNPLGEAILGSGGLSAVLLLELLGLLLLFAGFFAAVLLTITSFARSFKEAQAYLIPLMLMSLTPGAVGMIPGLELTPGLAALPLVNLVLLGRDLLDDKATLLPALIVVSTTLIYAAAALALASRVFGAEGVLYNEQASWGDLWRRPARTREAATPGTAFWAIALIPLLAFLFEALLRLGGPPTPARSIVAMVVVGLVLFVGLPALFVWRERVAWTSGFGLHAAKPRYWLAGLLLGLSAGAALLPVMEWMKPHLPEAVQHAVEEAARSLAQQGNLRFALVAALIVQAIAEELFFRGFVWNALAGVLPWTWTLLVTSFAFALAHVVMGGPLGLERLVPSLLLGLVLGVLRARSGSVLPGMVMHAVHNAILIAVGQSEARRGETLPLLDHWGVVAALMGAAIVLLAWPRSGNDAAKGRS